MWKMGALSSECIKFLFKNYWNMMSANCSVFPRKSRYKRITWKNKQYTTIPRSIILHLHGTNS
jgi:hypothetical protein